MKALTDEELKEQYEVVLKFVPESYARRIVEELVVRRAIDRAARPFPVFQYVDGETTYQTYHRGFNDAWKTQARFRA